ncbi:hypothetical protein [Streptomyces sp. 1331.2]|uniref:hypothetical protein n=1 Tax=Streptomyces sp. 1331.2 TaxID=1938835 RepID=UPI00117ED9A3|nr:hypothetical protein [Streptomyces sp. 1331.2]
MVETAAGVVEEVGKRVVGTAAVILEKAGVDVADVERRLGGQFPPSAKTLQTLAEEAFTAGRAGVDLAVGVARNEAEKVFEKVGDQVTKVGVVLAYLESKLSEVEEEAPAAEPGTGAYGAEEPVPAPRADDLFGRGWEFEEERSAGRSVGEPIVAERVEVDEPVEVDPPVPPATPAAPAVPAVPRKAPARRTAAEKGAGKEAGKENAAAGKPVAKKAPARKATAEKAPAEKTAGKTAAKAAAGKAAARKTTTVKKSATAKQAAAQPKAATQPKAAAKRTATKRTTVRKATSTKKPDARDE